MKIPLDKPQASAGPIAQNRAGSPLTTIRPVIRVLVNYQGRVQGVGFRATARGIARRFPVAGWVRNEADGSVALVVEGLPEDVEQFLAAVQTRLQAYIEREDRSTAPPTREFIDFEIRR